MAQAMEWAVFRIDMFHRFREMPGLGRHKTYSGAKAVADREDKVAMLEMMPYSYRAEMVRVRSGKEG